MKTVKITLNSIKDSDMWMEVAHTLLWDKYEKEHPDLDEDDLSEMFYSEVVLKHFKYGEFANFELEIDENFNIVGGKII